MSFNILCETKTVTHLVRSISSVPGAIILGTGDGSVFFLDDEHIDYDPIFQQQIGIGEIKVYSRDHKIALFTDKSILFIQVNISQKNNNINNSTNNNNINQNIENQQIDYPKNNENIDNYENDDNNESNENNSNENNYNENSERNESSEYDENSGIINNSNNFKQNNNQKSNKIIEFIQKVPLPPDFQHFGIASYPTFVGITKTKSKDFNLITFHFTESTRGFNAQRLYELNGSIDRIGFCKRIW